MTIQTVKLSDLMPPDANPRRAINAQTLQGLAQSIKHDGLLQNLVVKPGKGNRFRVVSGERRLRALQLLAENGDIDADYEVSVEIRKGLGKDDALRLAAIENLQRENLPPLDEAKALAKLIKGGERLEDIVALTGLSATTIRRRVILNTLCKQAQDALRDGGITLAQAEALTLGDRDRQKDVLDDLAARPGRYGADDIRDHLLDDRPSVAMAIFPLTQYTGTITTDLFAEGESSYFDDAEQFMRLQREAVEKLAKQHEASAAWVEVTNDHRISDWQYEEAPDGEQGGVLINLSPSGSVEIREGLMKPELDEETRRDTASHPVAQRAKAVYSGPLRRHIAWHKSLAVQEVLLADARKARQVALTVALRGLKPHGAVRGLGRGAEPGPAYAVLAAQARLFADRLGFAERHHDAGQHDDGDVADDDHDDAADDEAHDRHHDDDDVWRLFPPAWSSPEDLYGAVKTLTDHELDQLQTLLTTLSFGQENCEWLDTEQSLFNLVAQDLRIDMRNHWRPDVAFLEKRNREQLLAVAQECGCADAYGIGMLRAFKKSELVGALLRHFANAFAASEPTPPQQKARQWLPEAMNFPAVDPDAVADDGEGEDDLPEAA